MCALVRDETGLLPHANAGALGADELAALRPVPASQGMMLESLDPDLACHRRAPDKTPERRLATLEAAGAPGHPLHHRGAGRHRRDPRRPAATPSRPSPTPTARHGHVQEVIVQNFLPKPGTAMHDHPPCPPEELAVDHRRRPAPAPARGPRPGPAQPLRRPGPRCSTSGIDDWGGVSPVTADHVNPERAWPALDVLRARPPRRPGLTLAPRLTVYPEFAPDPERWLDPAMRFAVLDARDAEGLGREDRVVLGRRGAPARLVGPPPCRPTPARAGRRRPAPGPVAEVLAGVALGQEVGEDEIVTLFSARGPEVARGGRGGRRAAPPRRSATSSPGWPTATSTTPTSAPSSAGSAPSPRARSRSTCGAPPTCSSSTRSPSAWPRPRRLGATEVCLQGGIHPSFDGDYYLEVIRAVRAASERIHIHGFTALEVTEGARRLGEPLADYLGAAQGGRADDAAGDGGRDPRRRGPRRARAPTRSPPTSGSRPTARPTPSVCAPT